MDSGATRASRRPTIADVAARAGVSNSTVSRALDENHRFFRSSTAERIRAIAREVGYSPNPSASSLRRQRTQIIGLVVPRLTDTVMAMLYEHIAASCLERGYHALVATTDDDPRAAEEAVQLLLSRRVDGLILSTARIDDGLPAQLADQGVSCALVLRTDGTGPAAVGDDELGGYLATRYLLDLGHKRIGLVGGPSYTSSALGRRTGYGRALTEAGLSLDDDLIYASAFSMEAGEDVGRRLLAVRPRPTAIFAVNDNTAIGVMAAAQEADLQIPRDLSVVGYNDIPLAARMPVSLTTVRVPFREMADAAVGFALETARKTPETRVFTPTLIPRKSTSRPADAPGE